MALITFPFTQEQFLNIFAQYNSAVFPLQIIFVILGIAAVALAIKKIEGIRPDYTSYSHLLLVLDRIRLSHPFLFFH